MRRPLLAGNWKMHLGQNDALRLARDLAENIRSLDDRDVAIFPTYVSIAAIAAALEDSPISVGAQNCHDEDQGAFTGELSAPILKSAGAQSVLLGHSERRHVFGESDAFIARKMKAALNHRLPPVLCVGETLEERESGDTDTVVSRQIRSALSGVSRDDMAQVTIAYEPVWAIGTGKVATPDQAQETHASIRSLLGELYPGLQEDIRILYGGSVKPGNVQGLMGMPDIDGALVGGASLKLEDFRGIALYEKD